MMLVSTLEEDDLFYILLFKIFFISGGRFKIRDGKPLEEGQRHGPAWSCGTEQRVRKGRMC